MLACVASGASNREVAHELFISDKTVSRHLANMFLKTGVSSRTAAAAWAREHGIGSRTTHWTRSQRLHQTPHARGDGCSIRPTRAGVPGA